ncbi:MAG: hypothetical protein R3F53_26910 [Gammaproteobacteria bacterium]
MLALSEDLLVPDTLGDLAVQFAALFEVGFIELCMCHERQATLFFDRKPGLCS